MTLWRHMLIEPSYSATGRGIHEANDLVAENLDVFRSTLDGRRGIHEANDLVAVVAVGAEAEKSLQSRHPRSQ